ncbi:MAG: tyrosine-type recombinase/integrase [Syntrophomonadaceae bacterium]|nr:tyrosine-type recombinase/integrase [Syntrophomonadaceae bacterium]MDD4550390.1 tyrosine-type recombinase/integrase [Syntrophomonadaceae bacterium]
MYALSCEQVLDLLGKIIDHRDYMIIYTAFFTGMRQGELLGLRWKDVDFIKATISVR